MRGTVKFYRCTNGYGFIHGDNGEDYHFSKESLPRQRCYDPVEGDTVEFETRETKKGLMAHRIVLDPNSQQKDESNDVHVLPLQRTAP